MWSRVHVRLISDSLNIVVDAPFDSDSYISTKDTIVKSVVRTEGHAVWVRDGWLFNPAFQVYQEALASQDPTKFRAANGFCRKYLISIYKSLQEKGYFVAEDKNDKARLIEGFVDEFGGTAEMKVYGPGESGLVRYDQKLKLHCYLNVRSDAVQNALFYSNHQSVETNKFQENWKSGKRVAIGMPTTSKGMNTTQPIFFNAALGTLLETVGEDELQSSAIQVYIGYDHGDRFFDNAGNLKKILGQCKEMIGGKPIKITMVRLPRANRIGMLWSMLFARAMKDGHQYFYQINDDLRMVTKGWLTQFTTALDKNDGFGVVGPADNFVGFGCNLLTQAMVTRKHWEIFETLYPIEIRDWKTDVWLTKVYGKENTFCWPEYVANNGGTGTRYVNCPGHDWKQYLEAGQRRIQSWQRDKDHRK